MISTGDNIFNAMVYPHLYSHQAMLEHDPAKDIHGFTSPEVPDRLAAILKETPTQSLQMIRDQEAATATQLSRVHSANYVEHLINCADRNLLLDFDTAISPGSVKAATIAAGAAIKAVTSACDQPGQPTLAAIRPPGHHAEIARAMGFCLFNNIAVAAQHALDELNINRICIIDWDVHHGNGTQNIFYDRNDVLFISIHQSPLYPGSGYLEEIGNGPGKGFTVNVPMPAGQMDADYIQIFEHIIEPINKNFKPDLILISAGFDAHQDDPLGGMGVTTHGFGVMTQISNRLAKAHSNGKMSLILEGGYSIPALTESMDICLNTLAGNSISEIADQPMPRTLEIINRVKKLHHRWF